MFDDGPATTPAAAAASAASAPPEEVIPDFYGTPETVREDEPDDGTFDARNDDDDDDDSPSPNDQNNNADSSSDAAAGEMLELEFDYTTAGLLKALKEVALPDGLFRMPKSDESSSAASFLNDDTASQVRKRKLSKEGRRSKEQ